MTDTFGFNESGLSVRVLESAEDRHKGFRLRHAIYCDSLRWVKAQTDGLEKDEYEDGSTSLGVLTAEGALLGVVRMIPGSRPFMLESHFRSLVGPHHSVRKRADTAEVTRLATSIMPRAYRKAPPVSCLLYKAIYRWSCAHDIRYLYLVVETRYLKTLHRWEFPCMPIGPARLLGVDGWCVAALLDWDTFRTKAAACPSLFTAWITDCHPKTQAPRPWLWPGHGCAPPVSA